jgi:DNA-binding transcriptional MerR regulator
MTQPQGYVLTRDLPTIPAKRYFTIGEVSQLCDVRSYVLRYWEQEFVQLRPMKRRGNRRYYQLHEVELVRQIRALLYEQGFTIAGARLQLEHKATEDVMAFELSPSETPHVQASEATQAREQNIFEDFIEKDVGFLHVNSSIHIKNNGIQAILSELHAISVLLKV